MKSRHCHLESRLEHDPEVNPNASVSAICTHQQGECADIPLAPIEIEVGVGERGK